MDGTPPWHENPAFWEAVEPHVFPPETVEKAPEQLDDVLGLAGIDGGRVLDMPCGVGRHAVELAARGFEVTGVDATAPYLETARERAAEAGADVEFVNADMREFRRPDTFDLAVNLYTSFGYFEDRADDERAARNIYESLSPGGKLVMSLTSKEVLAEEFQERGWSEADGTYLLEDREVTDDWCWMENRWVLVADGETREFTVSHRLYSAYELSELLREVGFSAVEVYGDLDGRDFDEDAERLVVVAEK
ncbi:class I SAM-dependent methyltransferase [Natronomonas halophila]|uniref:class I SAM-dependent methyltransferase n=1 Tax=Natronomonas halophila TaxID=2747817 RepID=UPI0015B41D07|nr:class I SAM-dependent methyltransferase [Natronomonas halophila]QLD86051.1 class I SAM-dependent methyltransferase [Natronomonas halophila]